MSAEITTKTQTKVSNKVVASTIAIATLVSVSLLVASLATPAGVGNFYSGSLTSTSTPSLNLEPINLNLSNININIDPICPDGACLVKTWRKVNVYSQNYLSAALSNNGKYQYLGANSGNIAVSTDFGQTWSAVAGGRSGPKYTAIAVSNNNEHWTAVTYTSDILADGVVKLPFSNRYWADIDMSSDGKYQTAVASGISTQPAVPSTLFISTDYGVSWKPITNMTYSFQEVSVSSDGQYQAAVDGSSNVYISSDYGSTWTQKTIQDQFYRIFLSSDGSNQLAFAKGNGKVYKSVNFGVTWSAIGNFNLYSGPFYDIAVSRDLSKVVAVVNGGHIYTSQDSGISWSEEDSSRGWLSVAISADGSRMIAVTSNGIYTWP